MAAFRFRTPTPRTASFAIVLAAALGASAACGSGSSNPPGSTVSQGTGDRTENGVVQVDEAKIRGSIEDGTLSVSVPIKSLVDHDAAGTLTLHLTSVDGTKGLGHVDLPYSLAGGAKDTLTGTLKAPPNIAAQADLVSYNVGVEDGTDAGISIKRSLMYVVPLLDLQVEGPGTLRPGREAYYRLRVQDQLENAPVEGQAVTFEVVQNDQVVQTQDATTEVTGDAEVKLSVDTPGEYQVRARMAAHGTQTKLQDTMKVDSSQGKLLLTTDKPIYQPGQTINLRALALNRDGNAPNSGAAATFEVEDGKGNKVFKKAIKTDKFGVAATTFLIGSIVNEGTYKVSVIAGDVTSEKTVNVSHYALPKFDVAIKTEDPWYAPGTVIKGAIDSKYFFGKPVTGQVTVAGYSLDVGTTMFQQTMGVLTADGHFDFTLQLPTTLAGLPLDQGNAAIELRVTVTDSAGQVVEKSTLVTVSAQGANVSLVPESGKLVPGIENELLLFAADPLGTPLASTPVTIKAPDDTMISAMTDAYGQASIAWTPPGGDTPQGRFSTQINLTNGKVATNTFDFTTQNGAEHLLLRTDKSVYELGEDVKVYISSTEQKGTVYVDWLNDGQTVDMRTLTADQGQVSFSTTIDGSLAGSNRIEAYLVDDDGQIVRTGRTIFARNSAALNIAVNADQKLYAPGTPAKLSFTVTDETGAPKVAALGLQIVDQAVFSLVDAKPGLLRTYFELDDQLATPSYEIHPPEADFSSLLFQDTAQKNKSKNMAAQRRTSAALAAMKNTSLTGIQHDALTEVLAAATMNLQPVVDTFKTNLQPQLQTVMTDALAALDQQGCKPYVGCTGGDFVTLLSKELEKRISVYDFWGNAYVVGAQTYGQLQLTSSGADEKSGSSDDVVLSFPWGSLSKDGSLAIPGVQEGDNGGPFPSGAGGTFASGGGPSMTPPGTSGASGEPRVRHDFPETLYVNPSVITDANGVATVDVPLADSITEWRVSALGNSSDGRLGGSDSGITVFQDFFVDISFPAQLTRGDKVTFPIAVYNYLDTPQSVSLELQPGAWYTADGPTTTSVMLDPGQVLGVSFPVTVNNVGLQTLTVVAKGTQKSDAVARTVSVVPDGKAFPQAFSGSLDQASAKYQVDFPVDEVPGSEQLYLDVFPAFLAQAVQGMDSILREPTGCFEQTTSSAWPNVLVTQYMKDTKQITPEIELKAETLMSTGYQRLLTFEHKGGGFSWFGEQDPMPYLSVTAFGIMEFSDMSKVHEIDEAMLARTIQWISGQQQADGSYKGDMSEFFSFHTSVVRNTAFTAWALATAGETGPAVQGALDYVKQNLGSDNDPYTLGIVANAFALGAPNDPLLSSIMKQLEAAKISDAAGVHWDTGGTQTNFYGNGDDAAVSATALVAYAYLQAGYSPTTAEAAIQYLTSKKDPNGNFGSTQATIWTLRTLLLSATKGTSAAVGSFNVSVDGKSVQDVALTKQQSDVMTRVDLSQLATAGSHDVTLAFTGTGKPSYNLVSSHNLPWSAVPAEPLGPLSIDVAYDKTSLFVDDTVQETVTLQNNEASVQNMVLVTLGIAPGFSVNTDDLQKYLTDGSISRYEMTGRQLILYITSLAPNAKLTLNYGLTATMPVEAVDGGAEARMYYEPAKRARAAAKKVTVARKM